MNNPIHLLTLVYLLLFAPLFGDRILPLVSRVTSIFPVELEGGKAEALVPVPVTKLVPVTIS